MLTVKMNEEEMLVQNDKGESIALDDLSDVIDLVHACTEFSRMVETTQQDGVA